MLRELIGYALGFVLFIVLIPFIMWKVSEPAAPGTAQVVAFACVMAVQVKREESRLEAEFGDDYREYKKRTKRIIPCMW